MKPGVYHDLSNADYHASKGLSKSGLDAIAKSPAHYFAKYLDQKRPPAPEPTPALMAGTLAHCAALEPTEFGARYVAIPADAPRKPTDAQRNAKKPSEDTIAAIAWWDAFNAEHGAKELITEEQHAKAFAQAGALRRLPDIAEALSRGRAEVSAYWIDEATGLLCKCRPDWVHDCGDAGVILVDVKTTTDASPGEFGRSVAKWRYEVQDAWYSDGFEKASGRPVLGFVFAAVEGEWPYFAAAYMLDDDARDEGRRKYRRDLDVFAHCQRTDSWPGYPTAIQPLSLPAWAFSK